MEQEPVLESRTIGKNISMYRKIRGVKASDIAERLGISESSYTRYERGETPITIELVQQISEVLQVNPHMLLSVNPNIFIEIGQGNGSNSPIGIHGYYNHQTGNEQQTQALTKVLENMVSLTEKLIALLDRK
jgi:transcriptional regulator with XRE-family HTH domain